MIWYSVMLNMPHNTIVVHQGNKITVDIGFDSQINNVSHVTGQLIYTTLTHFSPEILTYIDQMTEVIIWLTWFGAFLETAII